MATYGQLNADNLTSSTGGVISPNITSLRNRIINGAMVIDQRNAGASVTPSGTGKSYLIDRWCYLSSQTSKFAFQQNAGSVTPPNGFINYLGATSQSAYTVGSSDYFLLSQYIEGLNVADLGWGTSNAKSVTFSFWAYSSLTGNFGLTINNNNNYYYPYLYSIPVANTWTYITVTIPGPTSGTWLTTNGQGIAIQFSLGAGSSLVGTSGTWTSTGYLGATGQVNVVGTNGATFYITGVQLEVGTQATSFDYRPYGTELALCQRYYETSYYPGYVVPTNACPNYVHISIGNASQSYVGAAGAGNAQTTGYVYYRVNKRIQAPTVVTYSYSASTTGVASKGWTGADLSASTAIVNNTASFGFSIYNNSGSTATVDGFSIMIHYTSYAEL